MAVFKDLKLFQKGGLDVNSAVPYIAKNDYFAAYNIRVTGTKAGEEGYVTNIESNYAASPLFSPSIGLNKAIGMRGFESIRTVVGFVANTSGYNEIITLNYDTGVQSIPYLDQISSASGANLLGLDPSNYVQLNLVNNKYLVWADGVNEVGYTNLTKLMSGGYGEVLQEDLTLIKPQNLVPITGRYISDEGRAANFIRPNLFQFTSQYVNDEFNYSSWATWSKRIIPEEESTPTIGADVTQNNAIVVSVNIGSIRATQINIAARSADFDFSIIKQVTREYVTSLPNTEVDVTNQIYEAYDPATNTYSFVFYNTDIAIPVPATQTDQFADYLWPAEAIEVVNNNIIAIGNLKVGYDRPTTSVTLAAAGYNPNITVPVNIIGSDRLRITYTFPGASGSGLGNHRRLVQINFAGIAQTGDVILVRLADIRNANSTLTYTYTVQPSDTTTTAIQNLVATIPDSSYEYDGSGGYIVKIQTPPYFGLQSAQVTLFNAGATVSKSIHGILDNSSYQLALSFRDKWGRPFPLQTGNEFIVQTPSFAQLLGNAASVSWTINDTTAPVGAVDYQWLITPNSTVIKGALLDVLGDIIDYKGQWNSMTNSPTLAANSGTVGSAYQIGAPNNNVTSYNLGNGDTVYNTGDYVVYNGTSWDILSKDFGDLTSTGNMIAIKINPLYLFNQLYSNEGVDTVLGYDFSQGDRCTFHAVIDPATPDVYNWVNNPCVDISVLGYDSSTYLLKLEKSPDIDPSALVGKNLYIRLYSPNVQKTTTQTEASNTTVWYEIGERFTITNGTFDTLTGTITDGDVYFKSRGYYGAVDPTIPYSVAATDFNFSDFYPSEYTSYGRPRSYYDILEKTQQKASIITSQPYIDGSRNNGLNRFYQADLYGDGNGQTSSSFGGIYVLWQRNDVLISIQELKVGYIPVNIAYVQLNSQITQESISEKLLNNIRYNTTGNIGIGTVKESFAFYNNNGFFVDPNRSEPIRIGLDGVTPISGKMSKYFKRVLQQAFEAGNRMPAYYDTFNNEYVLSLQLPGNTLVNIPFNAANWNVFDDYTIVPSDVISVSNGAHSSASYDNITGIATYIPASGYIGSDSAPFTFTTPSGNVTKNVCLLWTAGTNAVNSFAFAPLTGQPLSTEIQSNSILVSGNTIPSPISITGGEYSVNGGAFTSASGTVNAGDSVKVRVLSSASYLTDTSTTLTIDGQSATFTVTTMAGGGLYNYTLSAQYGMTIDSAVNGSCSGTPAAFSSIHVTPGNSLSAAYTTITAGTVFVTVSGTPVLPTVKIDLDVNGVLVDSIHVTGSGSYSLNFPASVNNPTPILISVDS